jgi:hypothetical protein
VRVWHDLSVLQPRGGVEPPAYSYAPFAVQLRRGAGERFPEFDGGKMLINERHILHRAHLTKDVGVLRHAAFEIRHDQLVHCGIILGEETTMRLELLPWRLCFAKLQDIRDVSATHVLL